MCLELGKKSERKGLLGKTHSHSRGPRYGGGWGAVGRMSPQHPLLEEPSVKGVKQSGSGIGMMIMGPMQSGFSAIVRIKTVTNSYLNRSLVLSVTLFKFPEAQSRDDKPFCRSEKGTISGCGAG